MSKCSMDTQTRFIWAILGRQNSPLKNDFQSYYEELESWCKNYCETYAFIGHDKDLDDEGKPKFRHIHLLAVLPLGKKPRKQTIINKLSALCDIPTIDIDMEIADNVEECIRYCLHRGYSTKHQYTIDELHTSLDSDELDAILNKTKESVTANYLISCCKINGNSYIGVMKALGIKSYMRYRNAIRDIIEEFKQETK